MLDEFIQKIITVEIKIKDMKSVKQNTLHKFIHNLQNKLLTFRNRISSQSELKEKERPSDIKKLGIYKKHLD